MEVNKIGVKVSRKIDTGFGPYMAWLNELPMWGAIQNGRGSVPFGTRDNSFYELEVYAGADLSEGDDIEESVADLIGLCNSVIDEQFGIAYPGALNDPAGETFMISRTTVEHNGDGEF